MAAGFSFSVLGPVRAWRDGAEVNLGSPQQRTVLAAILLRAGRGYVLSIREDGLDASRFRRLADRAARARATGDHGSAAGLLNEALALWKGEPLAGITGRFAETRRVVLGEMRLAAAEDWAGDNLALGRHAGVIPALASLTSDHPYSERLRELHMLALYRAGRQAEALAVFNEVRHLLATELGIDPGPRLQDLHLRVLNADPALMDVRPLSRARSSSPAGSGRSARHALGCAARGCAGRAFPRRPPR